MTAPKRQPTQGGNPGRRQNEDQERAIPQRPGQRRSPEHGDPDDERADEEEQVRED